MSFFLLFTEKNNRKAKQFLPGGWIPVGGGRIKGNGFGG
jgi:hypothetical protein